MSEVIWQFAGGAVDHGPYRPVAALIEDQTDRTPDRPAVVHRSATETVLTYAQFDALANGLAARLTAAGVGPGDMVPVVMGNSEELPVCMVALMKLGAVFTLCDPAWPEERMRAVLEVLDPGLVLTSGSAVPTDLPVHTVSVRDITPSTDRPGLLPGPDRPVYGVFTSGTTGTPKCAVNLHGGLTNRFRFMSRYFGADGSEVVLQNSRHTFDSAIWQLLWPLTTGGRTVIPEPGEFLDLERTVETIDRHRVTVTDFVPAILGMLVTLLEAVPGSVAKVASLRHLVVGGEEIIPHAVHRLRALVPGLEISNGYGPSETSIGMVFHRIDGTEGDRIPLGRPIDNCYAVVTDDDLRPLPPGSDGEILVGGACVGAGYLGDPRLTGEVFVPNPFPAIPGERLYRTGDLGHYDADGLLRFIGRRDRQTKVDGVRIELAEIETTAEGCPGVVQAKALTVRRAGRNQLVVAAAAESTTPAALRAHLAARLPRVQVPRHCFVLQSLPLTDTGKVDLGALRGLVEEKLESETRPAPLPGDALDERIARILCEVLGLPHFAPGDDFLARGGDSLSALGAAIRLRDELGVRLGISDLYRHRTPAALAAALAGDAPGTGDGTDTAALMERDAALDPALAGLARTAAGRTPAAPPETVLVTGGAGFVGARTVHRLLTATGARVVCLVRGRDDAHARDRVVGTLRAQGLWDEAHAARLEVYSGDLGEPRFGWPRETWDRLTAECDAVLNIAAVVNFLLDYRAHRPANVGGTAQVLRFTLTGRPKALHHVSTLGVLDHHAARAGRPLDEDFDPAGAPAPTSGYSRSKWVAERMLLEARRLGAPVTLHRLGEVMPAADTGVPNHRALTHLLLTAFHRLGLRPDVPMYSDYTPVDFTAERLVCALMEPSAAPVHHVFRPGSVDFTTLAPAGADTVAPAAFMAALGAEAEREQDSAAAVLHALLTALPVTGADGLPEFGRLLADNPALFTRHCAAALEARHGLTERPLPAAIAAYHRTLGA
ncbi:Linear gramicidin synthase subunit D [Streptomyces sp. RB5]|uniref:Linear gramicidin synthase subunit D n=1 Tax=Streptomyces smaragdinus TaxID=2585196 RepID=A0A7K0CFW6_9ACTN|nr:non-ribosomal peptide synthetase [Streptomyces smaragdinus]MQY12348.1 Linear gramicidin synthase subunit D [Streptomyces smaragdinus]